jgi:citrate/tricarballylate utilization protein
LAGLLGRKQADMLSPETVRRGQHMMAVCNACRYCEGYCPVFPAVEKRLVFAKDDLAYLANLCHNCGECLYACQFAPPHEFGIDVPRMLAEVRLESYEEYCWPRAFGPAFRNQGVTRALATAVGLGAVLLALSVVDGADIWPAHAAGDFYAIIPHGVMVALFGVVGAFSAFALLVGCLRASRSFAASGVTSGFRLTVERPAKAGRYEQGLWDALTLRHLHGGGADCTNAEEQRSPWRRWFHHLTMYGFGLCFASTSVAALYHVVFGWRAPYGYGSLPVVLGTLGGAGLLAGPAGLFVLRRRRDRALSDPSQNGLEESFIFMLFMTSATGLLLLALRGQPVMALLLVLHLGFVLGLFLTMPYGKFVHGLYRTAALLKYASEANP